MTLTGRCVAAAHRNVAAVVATIASVRGPVRDRATPAATTANPTPATGISATAAAVGDWLFTLAAVVQYHQTAPIIATTTRIIRAGPVRLGRPADPCATANDTTPADTPTEAASRTSARK